MPVSEREALAAYADDLLNATKEMKIQWRPVNPSAFMWENPEPPGARLLLQRVDTYVPAPKAVEGGTVATQGKRAVHILHVNDTSGSGMNVLLSGNDDPRINEKLGAIFEYVSTGIMEKRINFLRSTLPK